MRATTTLVSCTLLIGFGLLVSPPAMPQDLVVGRQLQATLAEERNAEEVSKALRRGEGVTLPDGRVRIIVQLEDPPVARYRGGIAGFAATSPRATGARKLDVKTPRARAYREYLTERQSRFVDELSRVAPGAEVDYRYQVVFNGVAMNVYPDRAEAIARMPGVKRTFADRIYHQTLDSSLPLINAPDFWNELGGQSNAGAGVKVGVIDGGIQPGHPMFDGTGFSFPPGFPLTDDYCGTIDPSFCNGKIIAARHFNEGFGPLHPDEVDSPLGINGHGTHVAGIAVGNPVVGADAGDGVPEDISGVAPGAWLMAYKALWWTGTTGSGAFSDLTAALEATVVDGADVVNNSWGGPGGEDPNTNPFFDVFASMNEAGVLNVVAAGNAGPGDTSIGCPGCQPPALTVAATSTNRLHLLSFDVTKSGGPSALGCQEGTGPPFTASVGPEPITNAGDVGGFEGCNAFPASSMSGSIALISRGSCTFATKVANAEAAGAVAMVVFNNIGGPPIVMGGLDFGETITSCMISNTDGIAARDFVQSNPGAQGRVNYPVSRVTDDEWEDLVVDFSSRGPNGDGDILKPDIAAPGFLIMSAWSVDHPTGGSEYIMIAGTSMASPHVAGSAALVMQQHPSWTPEQVKTALTSTSAHNVLLKEDAATRADPFDQGAGRVDLGKAKDAAVTFDFPSMADDACFFQCSFTRTIQNEESTVSRWRAQVHTSDPNLIVTVSPNFLTLDAAANNSVTGGNTGNGTGNGNGGVSFDVDVDTTLVAPGQWHFGHVVWKNLGGGRSAPDAVLPLAVFSSTSTDSTLLDKTVDKQVARPGELLTYDIELTNKILTNTIDLVDPIPENSAFVPGSTSASINGVPDPTFAFDSGSNSVVWSGLLDPLSLDIIESPSPFGYVSLARLGVGPLPCSSTCDDTALTLTGVPSFEYLGESFDVLVMNTNGFFNPGDVVPGGLWHLNQDLPDPAEPNNVIAAFWTDLDLDGTSRTDDGGGIWYAAILGGGDDTYTILEWEEVEVFEEPGTTYTFQIWIQAGTSNIWFVYAGLPMIPDFLTVGAEDPSGLAGISRYFDGTGTPPEVGTDLQVVTAGSVATFSYQVEVGLDEIPIINLAEISSNGTIEFAAAVTEVVDDGLLISVVGDCPGRATITGVGASPDGLVRLFIGDWPGPSRVRTGSCSGTELLLDRAASFGPPVRANGRGEFEFDRNPSSRVCGERVQALDTTTCTTSNTAPLSEDD